MTSTTRPARSYAVNYRTAPAPAPTATRTVFATSIRHAREVFEAANPGATVIIVRRG